MVIEGWLEKQAELKALERKTRREERHYQLREK
jgi:hypothetical protein